MHAAHGVDAVAGVASMRMMPSALGSPASVLAHFDELLGLLAERDAFLGDRLVERHRRAAAAVAEQHDLGDARRPRR
jgi:hypothetical protein